MKKFVVCFRTVMYLLALTLGFQSCDKDDDPVTNDKGQVLAVIYDNAEQNENWGEDTKTAPKTVWLQDDAIGVFCVEPGKSLGKVNFASNKKYVYNNGKFEAASEADKIWISREGTFKFYAYYPPRQVWMLMDGPLSSPWHLTRLQTRTVLTRTSLLVNLLL